MSRSEAWPSGLQYRTSLQSMQGWRLNSQDAAFGPHLVAVPILLPAWDDWEDNLPSVGQLGDASQGCHHQLLLVLQLGSVLQALQAAPATGAEVLAAGLCREVMLAQGALLHCCRMACTTFATTCAQQHPGPARYA